MTTGYRIVGASLGAALLLGSFAVSSSGSPIRKQIRAAKKELIRFERQVDGLVQTFHGLQARLEEVEAEVRDLERGLRQGQRAADPLDRALFELVVKPVAQRRLDLALTEKALLEDLVPGLRRAVWQKGLEREEKIEELDAAIDLLRATRSGELVTRAGVGRGQLITYSADWAAIAQCEAGGRWHINVGLFDGGLQFLPTTWWGFGGGEYARYAYQATPRQQIDIAERVLAVQGPNAWPNCFKALPADS